MILVLAMTGIIGSVVAVRPAQAQGFQISVDVFHRELTPHGRWVSHPRYGWTWFPTRVNADWRPYVDGHWVWTHEYGWYWVSNEEFGWATYHYGRWAYDGEYGWLWVPGTRWGPAWVAFRESDSVIGWAPLPPDTLDYDIPRSGLYVELTASYYQPRWVFVSLQFFTAPRLTRYVVPPAQNVTYIRQTTNVTNYVTVNNIVINRSIEPSRIERAIGHRIAPARVNQVDSARSVTTAERSTSGNTANAINVYRPTVRRNDDRAPPQASRARPEDRPRVSIQRDAVAPNEQRDGRPDRRRDSGTAEPQAPAQVQPTTTPEPARPARNGRPDRQRDSGAAGQQAPAAAQPAAMPEPARPARGQPDRRRASGAAGQQAPAAVQPVATPEPARPARDGRPDRQRDSGAAGQQAPAAVQPAAAPEPARPARGQPDRERTSNAAAAPQPAPAAVQRTATPEPGGPGRQGKAERSDCDKPDVASCPRVN
jgi:hypothetical protein